DDLDRLFPLTGTIFRIGTDGSFTSFGTLPSWGRQPNTLVQGSDGNFYGTTVSGGETINDSGAFYKLTPNGVPTLIRSFGASTGGNPSALVEGLDGNFYGTTGSVQGQGILFKITPAGELTPLVNF